MNSHDFLIIGAGIFGLSAAIELRKRKYSVAILNPDTIPHPLAASTDISKIVRMEYGSDQEYFDMAEICIGKWKEWNDFFNIRLYHEVGMLMLCKDSLASGNQHYEAKSYEKLIKKGYPIEKIGLEDMPQRFPAIHPSYYTDVRFNPKAGFVESSLVMETLLKYAIQLGVSIHLPQRVESFKLKKGRLEAIKTCEGDTFSAGQVIICAGSHTPLLVPDLHAYMRTSGHPIFHFKPKDPSPFHMNKLGVFMADISNTGWYGLPLHPREGVVKVGRHQEGLELHPDFDERRVTDLEVETCRDFLSHAIPLLADAPLVYTRRCLYTDTLDGHFWIDHHPEIKGLAVSSGGSGHGMKMGPLLGEMTADMAEGKRHRFSERYLWRDLSSDAVFREESRNS